ncbi:MAG: DsbA family protein [Pseudomonadota bacterium]
MTQITRRFLLSAATAIIAAPAFAQSADTPELVEIEDIVIGADDAPVTVIEYASFTCPHCARFHEGPYKQLKEEFIDTGMVKFIYREVFFDREGLWAAMLARCAGPERYMSVADMIYEQQSTWPVRNDPAQTEANLKKIGLVAGLDQATLDACFTDRTYAMSLVENYRANAAQDGVNSTPTLVVNGRKYNNLPYEELKNIVERNM